MFGIITSLSRITIITFISIFAILDIIIAFFKRNEELINILVTVQNVLMVLFLINGSLVLYVNTKDDRIPFLLIGQLLLFAIASYAYGSLIKNYIKPIQSNMFMFLSFSFIMLERLDMAKAMRQFAFSVISLVISILFIEIILRINWYKKIYYVYLIFGILLLGIVLIGGSVEYGAKLSLSFGNISIQPGEFVRLSYILFIAATVETFKDVKGFLIASIGAAIHVLILVASRDLGAAFIFLITYIFVTFIAYKNYILLLVEIIGSGICGYFAYILFPHIQTRFLAWKDPLSVVDNQGYQIAQSLFAIGTGGFLGEGICQGAPSKIPVVSKDFIFAAISEEMGGIVALSLIVMMLSLVVYIFESVIDVNDLFFVLVNSGIGIAFACQAFLNIGGVTKFIPSTGVTLPLISYGGSSILATFIAIMIIHVSYDRTYEENDDYDELEDDINERRNRNRVDRGSVDKKSSNKYGRKRNGYRLDVKDL